MRVGSESTFFEMLDECHRQIGARLKNLAQVARQVQANDLNDEARRQAAAVESFFSNTSHEHHQQEERYVFPLLLAIGDSVLDETVRTLQQEHAWIEAHWIGLSTHLSAIASGQAWSDTEAFLAEVKEFQEVLKGHLELEDTVIYPESRAQWARAVAARMKRDGTQEAV